MGYDLLYNKGCLNQNDGIIVYVKSTFIYTHLVVGIRDVKAIKLNLSLDGKKIAISSIYKSPTICQKMFSMEILNYLQNVGKSDIHVIAGDVNINILSPNEISQEYLNILNAEQFISYINKPTRIQGNSQSCIDHFFIKSSINEQNISSIIYEADITDHFPIMLFINLERKISHRAESNQCKQYINYNNLKRDLQAENWEDLYNNNNIDNMTSIFLGKLKNSIINNTNQIKIKTKNVRKSEWITPGII
ncbi:hypothetical protein NQ314_005869 [Rhamnusium bicolor]|uniref:Endonuclease/exonuclease/phosphatase domain-containing protein n=1 Tax=Rhamnusium bicolor TaxID=1586634 RepID=A0AAV8ZCM6_9CUCU|nr:hypothetical protein NQ314_005869 [Rhamnusium bicolor]